MDGPRLSIIPAWVILDARLKGNKDLAVLCMLGQNANTRHGWCRRSQVKLAEALGCSRSTVQASINRLVEVGAVERRVVESASGRDSAHWYRVVYDSKIESSAFGAWDGEDEKEFGPIDPVENAGTPAGITAPPAALETAPPAGPGSAPINASTLTPTDKREERERERDLDEGEENPKALERRFRKWWSNWPTYHVDAEMPTRRAWMDLTPDQRKACEDLTPDYLAAAKASGRKFSKAAATYLTERAWERLAEKPAATPAAPATFNPYSRPWSALRLAELSKHPVPLALDKFEELIVAKNPEKEEMIWRDKRMQKGWPEAVKLHEAAVNRKPVQVPAHIVSISQSFDKVEVGSEIWEAWKRLHQERGWPWMPEPRGLAFVQLPALPAGWDDPDEAVAEALRNFQMKLIERRDDDAA
jgi:hypothetical protein